MSCNEKRAVTFSKDIFFLEKSGLIESLREILLHSEIKTVCLDGLWGTGKTFFCQKLIEHLRECKEEPLVLYMDCFEEDSVNDPMLSLVTLLYREVDEDLKQKLSGCVWRVMKATMAIGVTTGLNLIVPGQGKTIVDSLSNVKKPNDFLSVYSDKKCALEELRGLLREIVKNKHVIFVLDELDRCRPDYSLKVLENVKHIFNVNKVKFLFSVNENILKSSIGHAYGITNCANYLDKFFEYKLVLPQSSGVMASHVSKQDCRAVLWIKNRLRQLENNIEGAQTYFILKSDKQNGTAENYGVTVNVMREVFYDESRTIRDAQKVMRYVELVSTYDARPGFNVSIFYLMSIIYFVFFQEEARKILNGEEVVEILSIAKKAFPVIEPNSQNKYVISRVKQDCEGDYERQETCDLFVRCLRMVAGFVV